MSISLVYYIFEDVCNAFCCGSRYTNREYEFYATNRKNVSLVLRRSNYVY